MKLSETSRFFIIFLIPLLFILGGTFLHFNNSFTVTNLDMLIDFRDDSLYVVETLTYDIVNPSYRELFRTYVRDGALSNIQIYDGICPEGSHFYSQNVGDELELICRNENYFTPGTKTIQFTYSIPEPYFCEGDTCVVHWKVFDKFSSNIENIHIQPKGNYTLFLSTPSSSQNSEGVYEIPEIYKNGLLELFVTVPRGEKTGPEISNLADVSTAYQKDAQKQTFILENGHLILLFLTFIEFGLILWIFLRFSKEIPTPGVPNTLHFRPTNRKPYEMDFLFGTHPGKSMSPNSIDATLLDLARRNYLTISKDKITVLKIDAGVDEFERQLLEFYKVNENIKLLKSKIKRMGSWELQSFSRKMDSLTKPNQGLFSKFKLLYQNNHSKKVWVLAILSLFLGLILSSLFGMTYPKFAIFTHSQILLGALMLVFDNYVFGRYSKEGIIEKRKWGAFQNLLCNTAQMKKYEPEDLSMWSDWLVFATAFGCAEKVLARMKHQKIVLPYVSSYGMNLYYYSLIRRSAHTQMATNAGKTVGSFSGSVGGGFGGGGGGAR